MTLNHKYTKYYEKKDDKKLIRHLVNLKII